MSDTNKQSSDANFYLVMLAIIIVMVFYISYDMDNRYDSANVIIEAQTEAAPVIVEVEVAPVVEVAPAPEPTPVVEAIVIKKESIAKDLETDAIVKTETITKYVPVPVHVPVPVPVQAPVEQYQNQPYQGGNYYQQNPYNSPYGNYQNGLYGNPYQRPYYGPNN